MKVRKETKIDKTWDFLYNGNAHKKL